MPQNNNRRNPEYHNHPAVNETLQILSKLTGRYISPQELLQTVCQMLLPHLQARLHTLPQDKTLIDILEGRIPTP